MLLKAFLAISIAAATVAFTTAAHPARPEGWGMAWGDQVLTTVITNDPLVTGRHESGSYYTPRPLVSFMCREALQGFLTDATQIDAGIERLAALL